MSPSNAFCPSLVKAGFVSVNAGSIKNNNTLVQYPYTEVVLVGTTTNYIYIDLTLEIVTSSTSGFPEGCFPIATATSTSGAVTLVDERPDVMAFDTASSTPTLVISGATVDAPTPNDSSDAPSGAPVCIWVKGVDGTYRAQAFLDTVTVNAPAPPAGTWTFSRRIQYNDSGVLPQSLAQNAALGINHVAGKGGVLGASNKDDRALAVEQTNTGTAQTFNQLLGIYSELLLSGSPVLGGGPYGETGACATRSVLSDLRSDSSNLGANKVFAAASAYSRSADTVYYGSCGQGGCAGGNVSTVNNTAGGSLNQTMLSSYFAKSQNGSVALTLGSYAAFIASAPLGTRWPTQNLGFYSWDYGTNVADWNIFSNSGAKDSGANFFGGAIVFGAHGAIRTARVGASAPGNKDVAGKLVFAAATTASYTYTETYSVAPVVIITPVIPNGTTFELTASSTTSFTVTANQSFTGAVNYITIGQN